MSKDSWASRGYCRRFIRNYADVASPLYQLIKTGTPWRWGGRRKERVRPHQGGANTLYPVLRTRDFSAEFIVHTDSNGFGVGAIFIARCNVLSHREGSNGPQRGNRRRKKITRDNLDRRIKKKKNKMTKRWKKYLSPTALNI